MEADAKVLDRLTGFVGKIQAETVLHYMKNLPNLTFPTFSAKEGGKFFKIITDNGTQQSVYCFVNKQNGDIYKAATWKAPAKHVRGNIFHKNFGWGTAVNLYGANYL